MGQGSSTIYSFSDDKRHVSAPIITPSGVGETVGRAGATYFASKTGNGLGTAIFADTAGQIGGTVGNNVEKAFGTAFFAQERIFADTYNETIKNGGTVSDAIFWGNTMSGKND